MVWKGTREASAGHDIHLTSERETTSDSLPKLVVIGGGEERNINTVELEDKLFHLNSSCVAQGDLLGITKAHVSQINPPHMLRRNPD